MSLSRSTITGGVAALLLAAACGTTNAGDATTSGHEPARTLDLRQACPGVHVAYDRLVAADPASAQAFEGIVRGLRDAATDDTREAIDPVLDAARELAESDRSSFSRDRDGLYAAISELSARCSEVGSPILHPGS